MQKMKSKTKLQILKLNPIAVFIDLFIDYIFI